MVEMLNLTLVNLIDFYFASHEFLIKGCSCMKCNFDDLHLEQA